MVDEQISPCLPRDVLWSIFALLPTNDLISSVALVCQEWRDVVEEVAQHVVALRIEGSWSGARKICHQLRAPNGILLWHWHHLSFDARWNTGFLTTAYAGNRHLVVLDIRCFSQASYTLLPIIAPLPESLKVLKTNLSLHDAAFRFKPKLRILEASIGTADNLWRTESSIESPSKKSWSFWTQCCGDLEALSLGYVKTSPRLPQYTFECQVPVVFRKDISKMLGLKYLDLDLSGFANDEAFERFLDSLHTLKKLCYLKLATDNSFPRKMDVLRDLPCLKRVDVCYLGRSNHSPQYILSIPQICVFEARLQPGNEFGYCRQHRWQLVDYELAGIELSTVEHIHIQSACHLDIRIIPMILAPMVKTISIRSYRLSLGLHKSMLYKLRILHKDVIVRIQTSNPMNEDDLEILREMGAKIHKWGGVQRIYLVIKKAKEDILLEIESDEEDLLPRPLSYVQEVPQPDRPAWEQKADPGVQEFEQSQRSYVDYLKFKEL